MQRIIMMNLDGHCLLLSRNCSFRSIGSNIEYHTAECCCLDGSIFYFHIIIVISINCATVNIFSKAPYYAMTSRS